MAGFNLHRLRFKNFMSAGAVEQDIEFENGRMTVVTGEDVDAPKTKRSGIGKAQPLSANVLTPTGWKKIGDLGVGDSVTTPMGTTTMVNGVYPQGRKKTYRVYLEDGRFTRVCKEHLWKIYDDNGTSVTSTERIIELMKTQSVYLPLMQGVKFNATYDVGCSPYLLGVALFTGEINDNGYLVLKTHEESIFNRLSYLYRNHKTISFDMTDHGIMVYDTAETDNLVTQVTTMTSSVNMYNFVERADHVHRVEFFKGICDVQGHEENNEIVLTVPGNLKMMSIILRQIAWSLGGICRLHKVINADEFMHSDDEYRLMCRFSNSNEFFSDLDKRVYASYGLTSPHKVKIRSIKEDVEEPCVCISLISSDKLYITDNYIVTHNTTVPNALCFGLYGKPVSSIKPGRLVNKRNAKEMYVRVDFEKDGVEYSIERGMKPDVFRFTKTENGEQSDVTLGGKAETQVMIERLVGMSYDLFTMIVTINTMKDSYMKSKLSKQRDIIEEILNISELTRKAAILAEHRIKPTKAEIEQEKANINATESLRKRISANLDSVLAQSKRWDVDRQDDIQHYTKQAESLLGVDIDAEIEAHQFNENLKTVIQERNEVQGDINRLSSLFEQVSSRLTVIDREIQSYEKKQCPTCHQAIHDDSVDTKKSSLIAEAQEYFVALEGAEASLSEKKDDLSKIIVDERRKTVYSNIHEAYQHREKINALQTKIEELSKSVNPFAAAISEAEKHLTETVVSYDKLKELERLLEHQLFLQKILTGRDSFVRKRIIDISIPLLNERIAHYVSKTDITHVMKFESDLTLEITNAGEDYDFDNLSRGEQNWAIISLNLAMRDLYEQIHGSINILFVDELIDFGIDTAQSVDAFNILRDITRTQNKSLSLITHREELFEKADDILFVEKSNGFSTYERITN